MADKPIATHSSTDRSRAVYELASLSSCSTHIRLHLVQGESVSECVAIGFAAIIYASPYQSSRHFMGQAIILKAMKRQARTIIAISLLAGTVGAFAWYLQRHPSIAHQLRQLKPGLAITLVALYAVWWGALAVVLHYSVRLYQKVLPLRENIMLSAYSNLINFFGPGQSGPGVRAAYLKKKHSLGVKQFLFASLIYYACYAVISAGLLFGGSQVWWKTIIGIGVTGAISAAVLRRYASRLRGKTDQAPRWQPLAGIFAATAVQLAAQCVIFGLEIRAVAPHASIGQIISYTGAANFSLYAALTPGAIGIREGFLLFTQNLHHLGSNTIVAANLIDRSAYLIFLGALFVVVLAMHAGKKLQIGRLAAESKKVSR